VLVAKVYGIQKNLIFFSKKTPSTASLIMFSKITLIFILVNIIGGAHFQEYRDFKINEQNKVSEIFDFCSKRPKIDFCSEASLQSMFKVLENQRKEYRKRLEQIEKTRLETLAKKVKQHKLKNFLIPKDQNMFF
jgi:hypothetical protein